MHAHRILLAVITAGAAACTEGKTPGDAALDGDAGPDTPADTRGDGADVADVAVDAGSADRMDTRRVMDAAPPPPWPTGMLEAPWTTETVRQQVPAPPPVDGGTDAEAPPDMRAPVPSLGTAFAGMGHIGVEARGPGLPLWLEDAFFFVTRPVTGDFDLVARIEGSRGCARPQAKFGVMVRHSLASNAPYLFSGLTGSETATIQYRGLQQDIARTLREEREYVSPLWVRVTRREDRFEAGYSRDGILWITQGRNITMDDPAYAGLAIAAHDPDALCGAVFSNVTIRLIPAVPPADAGGN